jgi:hypothetical protein
MSKTNTYQQCKIEKNDGSYRVIWGPSEKLIIGKNIKVEEDNGEWTEGWIVKEIYGEPLPEKYVRHMSHAHTRQRKASDI